MIKIARENRRILSKKQYEMAKCRVNTYTIGKTREMAKSSYLYTKKVGCVWLVVFFTPVIFLSVGLFWLFCKLYLAKFETRRLYAGFQGIGYECQQYSV